MRLAQDILFVVAKFLIFIGDVVLLLFGALAKPLRPLLKSDKNREKVVYSYRRRISFSLPRKRLKRLRLPHFNLHIPFKHKKRGRRKLPPRIPLFIRAKYFSIGVMFSFLIIFLPLLGFVFVKSLPNPKTLALQDVAQTTKIYDRNGILLYQIFADQDRTVVPLSQIPKDLQNATIAIEDKNFYQTPGFDILAIIRSAIADVRGEPLQGGSTLTQQLIKARLLTPERSIERKVKEIILAAWADQIYTKPQILEMYFNQVPYGGTAWGAQSAAETYFGKNVNDLTLAESAFLAGLPRAPSIYSPYGDHPEIWRGRQKEVLSQMVSAGFISNKQKDEALKQKLSFLPPSHILHAPHFVMYVKELLVKKYGLPMVERGGLNVVTSLDLKAQENAEKIVADEVEKGISLNFTNGAALITNPKNGDVLAMVGGKDYYDQNGGNFNVTTALRQPGSTIKVVTYLAALMKGFTAASLIADTPVSFASGSVPYTPVNYDGRFHGMVTLRNALGNSINIPAVKVLNQIGVATFIELGRNLGLTTLNDPDNYGLSVTLGSAEVKMTDMAVLYGSLANQGKKVELNPVLKITNNQGSVIEEKKEIKERRVIPQEVAYIISDILSDNNARKLEFGLNSPLNVAGHKVSVKTGTTDNKRDNWTIGYTPNYLVAVWVGNNDNTPMNPTLASGITGAAPIWNRLISGLLANQDPRLDQLATPSEIVVKSCGGRSEYFVKGTEVNTNCRPISLSEQSKTN